MTKYKCRFSTKEVARYTDYPYWRVKGLAKNGVIYSARKCERGNFYYPYHAVQQVREIKKWLEETGKSCADYKTIKKMLKKKGMEVKPAKVSLPWEKKFPITSYGQQSASQTMDLVEGIVNVEKPILENRVVEITITGENYEYCKKHSEKSCIDVSAYLNIRTNSFLRDIVL